MDTNYKIFPHIQVLRAISVLLVFCYHLKLDLFKNGYLGVDIFFVISGFVITKSLHEEFKNRGEINFLNFYKKRFKRIFPVLLFILTIVFIFYKFYGPPDISLKKDYLYSILGLSNFFYLIKDVDYFNNIFDNPVGHTWSLGIEEQFYIIYPLILFILIKNFKDNKISIIFYLIIFLSLIIINFININNNTLFYFPFLRFWEFFLGCVIPFLKIKKNNQLSLIFFILIFFIIFLNIFGENTTNSNLYILKNIFITFFVSFFLIFYNKPKNFLILFENRFFIFLGNLSYSIYLWHLPIIYFSNIYFNGISSFLISIFATIILSYFTFNYIENFFRYRVWNIRFFLNIFLFSFFFVITILFFTKISSVTKLQIFIKKSNYLEKDFKWIERTTFKKMKINNNSVYPYCTDDYNKLKGIDELNLKCLRNNNSKILFFLKGNSYVAQHIPMFNNLSQAYDIYYDHDNTNLEINFKLLVSLEKKYDKIYLVKSLNTKDELNYFINFFNNKKSNKNISFFFIGPIPNFKNKYLNPLTCMIQKLNCDITKTNDLNERLMLKTNFLIKSLITKTNNIIFFDIYNILCPLKKCSTYNVKKDFLMLSDESHLSYESSLSISNELNKFVTGLN
jgi:peptidoglycan/LPS O-acetylase OafA/YrhL